MTKEASPRRKKFVRQRPTESLMLTERDLEILFALRRFRFLKSSQIARFIAGKDKTSSQSKIKRRLQQLFHHGYIDRPSSQRRFFAEGADTTFVYALSSSGATALRDYKGLELPEGISWKNKKVTQPNLFHACEVAEVLLSLELILSRQFISQDEILRTPGSRLPTLRVKFSMPNKKTGSPEIVEEGIIPDGLFGIRHDDGKRSLYFVEVDRGTMPIVRHGPKQTSLLMKVRSYMAAQHLGLYEKPFGQKGIRTLFVLPSEARRDNLIKAVVELTEGRGSRQFIYATQDQFPLLDPAGGFLTGSGEPLILTT